MKINKEFILKNLITICCAASVLLLFLPFADVSLAIESSFIDTSGSAAISGFDTIKGDSSTAIAWLMIICPAILVAMNYIRQLDKYKSILAIILPVVSLAAEIATIFVLSSKVNANGMNEIASASVKLTPKIGFFLLIAAYVGTFIAGAMTFYGLKLNKEGIAEFGSKLKEQGLSGLEAVRDLGQNTADSAQSVQQPDNKSAAQNTAGNSPQKQTRKTNLSQASELLGLINQMAAMKDSGIITDEEFSSKKKELLAQI